MSEHEFLDAEGYSGGNNEALTFRIIVLEHLRNILRFSSVEFHGGYWDNKSVVINGMGTTLKVYVPDSREVYSNAVECLADILSPYFDQEMISEESLANQKKSEALAQFDNASSSESSADKKMIFRESCRKHNQQLFRALCKFLYRKKYLELGSLED